VLVDSVDLERQCMTVERTASESGGRRDVREDMKTRAAVRTVMIPDIAMPAVRRLVERDAAGRERSQGRLCGRLIKGERGGYLGYAMWRNYLKLVHGYTAADKDGMIKYTAHELRHACASLMIASGASDMKVAYQMGHSKVETTKNIYGNPRELHLTGDDCPVPRLCRQLE
jgi:integrase